MSHARAAYSCGHAGMWVVATVCALVGAVALGAQAPPKFEDVPIIRGAIHDTKTEALLRSDSGGGTREVKVYRTPGSIERLFKYYLRLLGGRRGARPDSLAVPPSGWSPITYHLTFHEFEDECVKPPANVRAAGSDAACKKWRRGKDKRRALGNARIPYESGSWIEVATLTWFRPGPSGDVERMQVEIRDVGMADNWRHDRTMARLTFERVIFPKPAP